MRNKIYILVGIFIVIFLVMGITSTYSAYRTNIKGEISKIQLAKFVFEKDSTQEINLDINNLVPGDSLVYDFFVANNKNNIVTDVIIDYEIEIETLNLIPVVIYLYKLENDNKKLVLTCNTANQNSNNSKINCLTEKQQLDYKQKINNSYQIEILYPEFDSNGNMWNLDYANKYDYISVKLNSYQSVS